MLSDTWTTLANQCSQCSLFLTSNWLETWLEVFGPQLNPSLLLFQSENQPVGACLVSKGSSRSAMIPVQRISLNATGESPQDATYSEFNDILCLEGWESEVAVALAEYLSHDEWDELSLDGFTNSPIYQSLLSTFDTLEQEETWHPSYFVNLQQLRHIGQTFEMSLSQKRRKHLRQSNRYFATHGPIQVQAARTPTEAVSMFNELGELNLLRRKARGGETVFASPMFLAFHRALITKHMLPGVTNLLAVRAGEQIIGLVYNLIHKKKVYFYQCGFNYSTGETLSPGIVTLAHVIQFYLDHNYHEFDFLSGESDYKQSLSTDCRNLVWTVLRKPGLKHGLIRSLRGIKTLVAGSSLRSN